MNVAVVSPWLDATRLWVCHITLGSWEEFGLVLVPATVTSLVVLNQRPYTDVF